MSTPRSSRLPPTPRLSERKRNLFPSPLRTNSPQIVLSEISNTPRRSNRLSCGLLTPVRECNENVTPSSRSTAHTPLYLSGDSSDLGHMSPLELSSSPRLYDSPFRNSPQIDSPSVLLACPRFFNSRLLSFDDICSDNKDTGCKKLEDTTEDVSENEDVGMMSIDVDPDTPRKDFSGIFIRKEDNKSGPESRPYSVLSDIIRRDTKTSDTDSLLDTDSIVPETPQKISPLTNLRTPNDIISENSSPPKLHFRKSFADLDVTSPDICKNTILKRKSSKENIDNQPSKVLKLEEVPKARASLFPEPKSLFSAKSFYPKVPTKSIQMAPIVKNTSNISRRNTVKKTSNRKPVRQPGQINLGVTHKIRKPKSKRSSLNVSINLNMSRDLMDTAINIIDNSPLNNYLKSLETHSLPSSKTVLSQAVNINDTEHTVPLKGNNSNKEFSISLAIDTADDSKENCEPATRKKFFKNRRSFTNKVVKLQDNIVINIKTKKNKTEKSEVNITSNNAGCDLFKEAEADLTPEQNEVQKLLSEWQESDEHELGNSQTVVSEQPLSEIDMEVLVLQQEIAKIDSEIAILSNTRAVPASETIVTADTLPLSPTSQISSMTSTMALDSPVYETPLSQFDNTENNASCKLFPLFYKGNCQAPQVQEAPRARQKNIWKPNGAQYQIDAGQKRFGATVCQECGLMYQIADPDEELFHLNYHNSIHVLNFTGWRNERVISILAGVGRIIHVKSNAPKTWHKKVGFLLEIVDNELGIFSSPYEPSENIQVYLMVNAKQIVGLVMATTLLKANRLVTNNEIQMCTVEEFDVTCGVSRIWVAPPFRHHGIATAILNAMRCNFIFGRVLDLEEIAFSTPTPAGTALIKKFTKREDFLVFNGC